METYKFEGRFSNMRKIIALNEEIHVVKDDIPDITSSHVLIKTLYSVISPGTERLIIQQSKNNNRRSLGYSAVGMVQEVGEAVQDFAVGDIVACYGAPYVHHCELLLVPQTLCKRVPENVSEKEAALSGLGAIAIHALRVAKLEFGETVIVAGLGLLGQLIAKIANAAAYDVIALDISKDRVALLENESHIKCYTDVEDMERALEGATNNLGVDAVLLCYGGPKSSLSDRSLAWIRDKGKIVIVGDIEPHFSRDMMFSKEAEILISRGGGPGRYDPVYEAQAVDYPYGFVRWTEGRNMEAYLRLVSEGRLDVSQFIKEEIAFEHVLEKYENALNRTSSVLTKLISFKRE